MSEANILWTAIGAGGLAVVYGLILTGWIMKQSAGSEKMRDIALAIQQGLKPDGLNLLQANGAAAFQSVPHFHLHVIPRWTGDGKGFDWPLTPGNRDHIMKIGERLRGLLK